MNECKDCDRMDCRDRGCIASTSTSNTDLIVDNYQKRPRIKVFKSRNLDLHGGTYTLDDLSELKHGATLTIDLYYDEMNIFLSWEEDETDQEYIDRMIKLDKAEERKRQKAAQKAIKKAEAQEEKKLLNSAMNKLTKEELQALKRSLKK